MKKTSDILNGVKDIIINFKKDYNENYLEIKGLIDSNKSFYEFGTKLNITCNSEFNNKTLTEIKKIEQDFYEKIKKYLKSNNIKKPLIIETRTNGSYTIGYTIYFKQQLNF